MYNEADLKLPLQKMWPMEDGKVSTWKPTKDYFTMLAMPLMHNPMSPFIGTGWELEAENVKGANWKGGDGWSFKTVLVTEDGSLKDYGSEFITKGGQKGDALYFSLLELERYHSLFSKPWNFSHRCSFHVHLDVRDFTLGELINLVGIYMFVEPLLFSKCEEHRAGNSYCVQLNHLSLDARSLMAMNLKETKYWALSLNRLRDLGTVEFRMRHGSARAQELMQWISYLHKLWIYARTMSTPTLLKTLTRLRTKESRENLAIEIFSYDQEIKELVKRLPEELKDSNTNAILFLEA
jgi:hypothetical protein